MKLTVGKKIVFSFAIIILFLVIIGIVSSNRLLFIDEKIQNVVESWLPGVEAINNFNYLSEHIITLTLRHRVTSDAQEMQQLEQQREEAISQANEILNNYEKTIYLDADQKNFDKLEKEWKDFEKSNELTIQSSRKNDEVQQKESFDKSMEIFNSMQTYIDKLVAFNRKGAYKAGDDSTSAVNNGLIVVASIIILTVVMGIFLSIVLIKMISRPLVTVTNCINEVANGNLKIDDVIVKNRDEIGVLANSVNTMKSQLSNLISNMLSVSQNVKQQSEELTQSSNELKIGTEQVASAMEQISSFSYGANCCCCRGASYLISRNGYNSRKV